MFSVPLWFPSTRLRTMPALDHLAGLFYADMAELGTFEEVLAEAVPEPYRTLLAHHEHMTVAVEQHHGSPGRCRGAGDSATTATTTRARSSCIGSRTGRPCCSAFRGSTCGCLATTCGGRFSARTDAARPRADRPQRHARGATRLAVSHPAGARPAPADIWPRGRRRPTAAPPSSISTATSRLSCWRSSRQHKSA